MLGVPNVDSGQGRNTGLKKMHELNWLRVYVCGLYDQSALLSLFVRLFMTKYPESLIVESTVVIEKGNYVRYLTYIQEEHFSS